MLPARLWIDQLSQPSPPGTVTNDLPGPMPVDAEDEPSTFSKGGITSDYIVSQHFQSILIKRQSPHTAALLFLNQRLLYLCATLRAEGMGSVPNRVSQ